MKIGAIGAGNVGGALTKLWREAGHNMQAGGRDSVAIRERRAGLDVGAQGQLLSGCFVPGLDGLDGVCKRLRQDAPSDGHEHDTEEPSLEVLAVADDYGVHGGPPVRLRREGVGVARVASPDVGVDGGHDDAVGIGPVVAGGGVPRCRARPR